MHRISTYSFIGLQNFVLVNIVRNIQQTTSGPTATMN